MLLLNDTKISWCGKRVGHQCTKIKTNDINENMNLIQNKWELTRTEYRLYADIATSQHYNHVAMAVVVSFLYDIGEPEHAWNSVTLCNKQWFNQIDQVIKKSLATSWINWKAMIVCVYCDKTVLIVNSILRFTASDYLFGIFNRFLWYLFSYHFFRVFKSECSVSCDKKLNCLPWIPCCHCIWQCREKCRRWIRRSIRKIYSYN